MTDTDLDQLAAGLRNIAHRYRTTFETLAGKRSALLEYAALMLAVERYAEAGYSVKAEHLVGEGLFRVKKSSNGHPANFSWYEVRRGPLVFELMTNAKVRGAFAPDRGTYVVDVAVLAGGSMTQARTAGKSFAGFENDALWTFIESKALTIYPMLLAQFLGIVSEITPQFLAARRRRGHVAYGHFDPALVALGGFSANADRIVSHYPTRRYHVNVVERFDIEAARGTLGEVARQMTPALP